MGDTIMGIFIRWLVLTIAIIIAFYLLNGIRVSGFLSALSAAAILGILNAFFRPILIMLTPLPLNIMTLGIFAFVINAILLLMAPGVISGFELDGFWPALSGSLLISVVSWVLNSFINEHGKWEYKKTDNNSDGGN
jgi:putative membrane protein